MPKNKSFNPFYILLLLSGTAFAITAMAYGVMTVRDLQASRMSGYVPADEEQRIQQAAPHTPNGFDHFMDRNGVRLLVGELVLLTIGTVGAIGYDQHIDRKLAPPSEHSTNPEGRS